MRCTACHRRVTRPQYAEGEPYGFTCYARLFPPTPRKAAAAKHKRRTRRAVVQIAAPEVDPRQTDLFADDLAYAHRVDSLLSSISLEMPHA